MNFDKVDFRIGVLSDRVILSDANSYLKLSILDPIGQTEVGSAEYKIRQLDGRNEAIEIIAWTPLTRVNEFFESNFTATLTQNTQLELDVKITDIDGNEYISKENLEGVIV